MRRRHERRAFRAATTPLPARHGAPDSVLGGGVPRGGGRCLATSRRGLGRRLAGGPGRRPARAPWPRRVKDVIWVAHREGRRWPGRMLTLGVSRMTIQSGVVDALSRLAHPWASLYNDSPALQTIVTFLHLASIFLGGGFAIATDRETLLAMNARLTGQMRHLAH